MKTAAALWTADLSLDAFKHRKARPRIAAPLRTPLLSHLPRNSQEPSMTELFASRHLSEYQEPASLDSFHMPKNPLRLRSIKAEFNSQY